MFVIEANHTKKTITATFSIKVDQVNIDDDDDLKQKCVPFYLCWHAKQWQSLRNFCRPIISTNKTDRQADNKLLIKTEKSCLIAVAVVGR